MAQMLLKGCTGLSAHISRSGAVPRLAMRSFQGRPVLPVSRQVCMWGSAAPGLLATCRAMNVLILYVPQIASPVARGFAVQAKAVALNDKVGRPTKQSADLGSWLHSI